MMDTAKVRNACFMRILCATVLLIFVLSSFVSADELVNQRVGGLDIQTSQSPAEVRYWPSAMRGNVAVRTIDPGVQIPDVPRRADPKLLIVMYHNIVFGRTGNSYNRDIYNFEHDMAYLLRNYRIIDFQQLGEIVEGRERPTTDVAIVTFDDGDLSMYAIAYRLLQEIGIKATFFLVPDYIGTVGYMSWEQVREMDAYRTEKGERLFSFGSHTLSHATLGDLPYDAVLNELVASKAIMEQKTGTVVDVLALPFGSGEGNPAVLKAAVEAGYRFVRSSRSEAVKLSTMQPMNLPAFNVENYSSDLFVRDALRLTGR